MKLSDLDLTVPANPEAVHEFMKSVQPLAPSIWRQLVDTATHVKDAVIGAATTTIGLPGVLVEKTLYTGANVLGASSATLNKIAGYSNHTRARVISTIQKKTTQAA